MLNLFKYICFTTLMLLVGTISSPVSVSAQSLVLHEGDLQVLLEKNAVATDDLWIINGNKRLYQGGDQPMVAMGKLSGLLWNIAAMRLIDKEAFSPDKPVVLMIDDFDLDSSFRTSVTLRHLLAGSAGFATPPWYAAKLGYDTQRNGMKKGNDWREHLIPVSSPGYVGRDDPAGQALLAKVIISYWGGGHAEALQDLVFTPLGLPAGSVKVPDEGDTLYDSFFAPSLDLSVSREAFAALLGVLSDNHLANGELFLSLVNHTALMKGAGWRVHPLGPGRSYGFSTGTIEGRRTAQLLPSLEQSPRYASVSAGLIAFPDAGIVLAIAGRPIGDAGELGGKLRHIAQLIAREFIPRTNWFRERNELGEAVDVWPRDGFFMLDNAATSWLGEKLYRARYHSPYLEVKREAVTVTQYGVEKVYRRIEPRIYKNSEGESLFVSDGRGGYITIGEKLYRYTGAMGNPYLLIAPVLLCLITLLSAGVYWFSRRGQDWRRFARWTVTGALLFIIGFAAEVRFYPTMWIEEQSLLAVVTWRTVFNIGLMLLLTAPMYAWRFGKQNAFHKNVKQMMLGTHVIVIAAAALVFALLSVAWGLAGELMP